jgi:hypothetical protein
MDENSPQGSALLFNDPYIAEIRDDDLVSVRGFYDMHIYMYIYIHVYMLLLRFSTEITLYFSMDIFCAITILIYNY